MAGPFDDLIPAQSAPPGNPFGDLIPNSGPAPVASAFDDLVPKGGAKPGAVSSFLSGLAQGYRESLKGVQQTITGPFKDQAAIPVPNQQLAAKLATPLSEGWTDPSWWTAQIGHGIGGSAPPVAGAILGGLGGEAIVPEGGGLVGAPAGAFLGSALQELAPAYQAARAQGLSHEDAVKQAIKVTGITGAGSALMAVAPIFKFFGMTAEGAIEKPISEALAQIFGVQPAIGTATTAAASAASGQKITPAQLAEAYVTNAAAGVPFVAAHGLGLLKGPPSVPEGAEPPPPPEVPLVPEGAPARPTAAPTGPLPPIEPGAIVGVRGPDGPMRAQIASIADGLVHWTAPDGTPRVDDLAAFQRDVVPAPAPADVIRGDATTVPPVPPRPIGEPPVTEPDQFAQAFREGPPVVPREAAPVIPSPQGAMPLPDTTSIDATLRAAAIYRVNAEKARIAGSKTPEQIGDMNRIADQLEQDAHNMRGAIAAPRTFTPDVTLPQAPALTETLLNRAPVEPGPEPTFGPPSLEAQMGELGRAAPEASVATTGQEPEMGTKPVEPTPEFALEPPATAATPRPPAAEKPDQTLLQFLRSKGGVQDEGGELRGMDLNKPQYGVGSAAIIRKGGMDWDEAVRAAQEAGYIGEGAGAGAQVGPETTQGGKQELIDRISREVAGEKQYPVGSQQPVERDLGAEADAREIEAMALERRALLADLSSLGETDIYHLDNDALKDRLDERLGMTGMDNVEDARRAIEAEEGTLNRLLSADAAVKAAITAEDTKGDFNARKPAGPGDTALGDAAQGTPQAPVGAAAEVAQPAAGGDQAPGTVAQGGPRTPTVENIQTVEGPRPHYVLPGMEQSAVQAQVARDARGMTPNVEQKPANEGLFAPVETATQQVIPGVSGEATAQAVDPGAVATGVKQAGKAFGDMLRDESGAMPRREKLLTDAERMAAQLEASKPDSLRGISMIAQYTGLAQSIAEKDPLGAAYLSSRENRTAARHSFQSDAQQSGGAWLRAPEATQTKINKVLEYQTMTNREVGDTGRPVVVHYDLARDFPGRPNPLQIIKPGETVRLNAAESKMFHDINNFMGRAWKQHAEADARKFGYTGPFLRTGADGKLEFDMGGIQNAIDTAPDRGVRLAAERAMGFAAEAQNNARKGYFPLMRYGDWTITVTPKVPKSGTGHALRDEGWFAKVDSKGPFESLTSAAVGHDLSGTPKRVAQEMARLKQRFPDKDYNMIARRQDPKTADLVDLAMVNRVLADTKLTDPQTGERLADEVIGKLYDQAKAGYRQPREGIPGYSTDFSRAFSDYARQWSSVTAEKLHGDGIRSAYDATQAGPDKRAASYWKNYAAYNDNPQPWIYGAMKRVGFLNWLWGSPSSAAIQLTQTPLLTGTQAGLLVGHARAQYMAGTLLTRAMAAIRPSGKGFALDIKDMGGLTARERAALAVADKEGRLQPVLPTDFAGGQFSPEMRRRFAPAVRVYDIGASMFNTADRANRITAWLTAYRAAQMPGVADKAARIYRNDALYREQVGPKMDPAKFANWFTNETQFLSGREGSSPLMRGPGSVAFQFQHYNSNMLRVMRKNLVKMGPEGKAAFAVMLTGLTLGAGLGGLPFVNDAERLANEVGKWINNDIDPRLDAKFREMIADSGFAQMAASFFGTDPMHVAEATTEGLSRSVLGLDLGRRIGLGNILPDSTDLFTAVPFVDATVGKAMEVAKRLKDNQTLGAAAALAPAAFANPIKAFGSWPNEGINPQAGGVPYFKASQVTPGMQAARALGFQPASVARRQEFMADQNAIKFATDAAQKQLVKSISDAYGRAVDASQAGNAAAAKQWTETAEAMLRANAQRLADPNIPAWQQIPQPMANALKNRIAAYLMEPGTLAKSTNKMKVPELLNSPYLSQ